MNHQVSCQNTELPFFPESIDLHKKSCNSEFHKLNLCPP